MAAVLSTPVDRRVLVFEGEVGAWLPAGIEVLRQRGHGLDERLDRAFVDIGGPTLIIGMDTFQVQCMTLARALAGLRAFPAILGPALDGGYWAVRLRRPEPRALLGIPMSTAQTFERQRARFSSLGFAVGALRALRDVDTHLDALAVAAEARGTRFAAAVATMRSARATA